LQFLFDTSRDIVAARLAFMMADLKATKFEVSPTGVATIMLSRPKALNALNGDLNRELVRHFGFCDKSPDIKVVVLTGDPASITSSGRTIFCAGADLSPPKSKPSRPHEAPAVEGASERATASPWSNDSIASHRDGGGVLALTINRCRKPVIAAINGTAVGGGLTPTLACDLRIVADDAQIGFVFARRGIVPEAASSYFLPKLVGVTKAMEWCLSGRVFPAREAHGTGLFNYILPQEEVYPKAMELAAEIAESCSPSSVTLTKFMLWKQLDGSSPEAAHLLDSRLLQWSFKQPDSVEGVQSFLQKRSPKFRQTGELPDDFPWWPELDVKSRL